MRVLVPGLLLLILGSLGVAQDADKKPVPPEKAQAESEKLIREIFAEDYRKQAPADLRALAKKLHSQSKENLEDAATLYVLLREARDLSLEGGDVAGALEILKEMESRFLMDATKERSGLLRKAVARADSPSEAAQVTEALLEVIDLAIEEEDLDLAQVLAKDAVRVSRRSKSIPLAKLARTKADAVKDIGKRLASIRTARIKLESSPDDAASNEEIGRYLCLVKGNWEEGLPYLAKGKEKALRELATGDLSAPSTRKDILARGDAWWGHAEKAKDPSEKASYKRRAAYWYRKAIQSLEGLTKLKVERRLKSLGEALSPAPGSGPVAGLVGHWTFDDGKGSTARDISPGARHGTLAGGVEWVRGKIGAALKFDGRDDHVNIPEKVFQEVSESFTVAFWAWPDSASSGGKKYVVYPSHGKHAFGSNDHAGVGISVSTTLIEVREHSNFYFPAMISHTISLSAWTHVALVYDARSPRLYVNGKKVAEAGPRGKIVHPGSPIGGLRSGVISGFYAGLLDDIRIYSRALTGEEIVGLLK